ncbi:MAG: hypothetical protein FIB01_00785, partial [Gemmatimonadetes bacterium]|nr:hypothetical protein [Gemmatimonadota bacterium]
MRHPEDVRGRDVLAGVPESRGARQGERVEHENRHAREGRGQIRRAVNRLRGRLRAQDRLQLRLLHERALLQDCVVAKYKVPGAKHQEALTPILALGPWPFEERNVLNPAFPQFLALCAQGAPVPVWREFLSDTDTPVTAYARLARPPFGFLLESLVGGEKWARYTILGTRPRAAWKLLAGGRVSTWTAALGWSEPQPVADPLADLATRLGTREPVAIPGLPRFTGGAVGYLGYDVVRCIERLPAPPPDPLGLPEALFLFTDVVLVFDNVFGRAMAITTIDPAGLDEVALRQAWKAAGERLDATLRDLATSPGPAPLALDGGAPDPAFESSYTRPEFERHVQRIREYIAAGDAFQVVLSQRLSFPLPASPLQVYRGLRSVNPS